MSPREAAAAAAVADVLGAGADETIQSYVAGVVSDDHFDSGGRGSRSVHPASRASAARRPRPRPA